MRGIASVLLGCTITAAFVPHQPRSWDAIVQARGAPLLGSGSSRFHGGGFPLRTGRSVAQRAKGFGGMPNPVRSKNPEERREERERREAEKKAAKEKAAAAAAAAEAAAKAAAEEAQKGGDDETEEQLLDPDGEWLKVMPDRNLGAGAYGEVYEARIIGGPLNGTRAVAKSAVPYHAYATRRASIRNSLTSSMTMSRTRGGGFTPKQFLEIEARINAIVAQECPEIGAEYIGECEKDGKKWVVWRYESKRTLRDLFDMVHDAGTLRPFAKMLGFEGYDERDGNATRALITDVARELLTICTTLTDAGLIHRDMKPANVIVHRFKLLLIDFGAAAAMGLDGQIGYDPDRGPCDVKYNPPEQLVDEDHWEAFDAYSVGLILLRLIFRPLWDSDGFTTFIMDYRANRQNVDAWLTEVTLCDPAVAAESWLTPEVAAEARARANKHKKPLFQDDARKQAREEEYLKLAALSCRTIEKWETEGVPRGEARRGAAAAGADDSDDYYEMFDLCALRSGLELLSAAEEEGGVGWTLLRGLLMREPGLRLTPADALAMLPRQSALRRTIIEPRYPAKSRE